MHTEIWVPGTIAQLEHADRPLAVLRKGWGTVVRQEQGANWVHFPLAVPYVLLGGGPFSCNRVFAFHHTTDGAFISSVHVYNGRRRIQAFEGLDVRGDNTEIRDGHPSYWTLDPTTVKHIDSGLGISVSVDFGAGGEILFTGAGGHFQSEMS
jgi:hypothetical protein